MTWSFALTALQMAACGSGVEVAASMPPTLPEPELAAEPDPVENKASGVGLEWTLELAEGGKSLVVNYSLTNHLDQGVYVCDELVIPIGSGKGKRAGRRFIVGQDAASGPVVLVCGARNPVENPFVLQKPIFVSLEAGATLSRSDNIPLPLTAWSNLGRIFPLEGELPGAELVVDYFAGEPGSWSDLTLEDGTVVRTPKYDDVVQSKGAMRPIPKAEAVP
jgi:hypothetical protein